MQITFDGTTYRVDGTYSSILEIAQSLGINIHVPCFREIGGCSGTCLIEVDGIRAYACDTKPKDGMRIVCDTPILCAIREALEHRRIYSVPIPPPVKNQRCKNCKCARRTTECRKSVL